mgnify:CR=1 FL=1
MIGILGGMGTQAGLDFCNKLAKINTGKLDQQYPMFVLYNKTNTPKRPENLKKYYNVLKELVKGCKLLEKNKYLIDKFSGVDFMLGHSLYMSNILKCHLVIIISFFN